MAAGVIVLLESLEGSAKAEEAVRIKLLETQILIQVSMSFFQNLMYAQIKLWMKIMVFIQGLLVSNKKEYEYDL